MAAPAFEPKDAGYAERVRASFARQAAMRTIGASLVAVEPGRVVIELPWAEPLTQQHGFLHAGMVATALDSACGYAGFSLMPADAAVLTIEFKINLLAPAKGEAFVARGRVLRAGKTLTVCLAEVAAREGGEETPIATMLSTLIIRPAFR
jgi:uncharacterized protein (TIGR00369 family)